MAPKGTVRKQTTLGGAAGIALLGFALVYRFFPSWIHVTPSPRTAVVPGAIPSFTPPPIGVRRPEVADDDLRLALEMGPPAALAPRKADEVPDTPEKAPSANVTALLAKADKALAEGHLAGTGTDTALALYREVLDEDAGNRKALAGVRAVREALADHAREALEHGDASEAEQAIVALSEVARDAADLEPLRQRLKVLREVQPLLARAADLLKEGRASGPGGETALAIYRRVRELDPDNAVARQGLETIQRGLLDQALAAIAQDDYAGSEKWLAEATAVLPDSQALLDTRSRIEGLRRQQAESVLAQARSALDGGDAALAEQLVQRALAISNDLPGIDEFRERLRNARLYANLRPGEVITDPFLDRTGTAPALVVVPAGRFRMGSPASEPGHYSAEEPEHEVVIDVGFALGRSEVTVGQFREFVRASGYGTAAEKEGGSSVYDETSGRMTEARRADWRDDYRGRRAADNLPVIHVNHADASAYVEWLAERTGKRYRLPSEAEFEYALRTGKSTRYPWGDDDPVDVVGNLTGAGDRSPSHRTWSRAFPRYGDGYWGPAPVMSFPANAFGLFDMEGNVSEWVADCWHDNYIRAPRDSRAWINPGCERRVVRGGSWGSDPDQARSAFRLSALGITRSARVGFRVARDL